MASIFHYYYTAKVVGIENKTLGYLYYMMVLAILCYLSASILLYKGYMEYDVVLGAAELKLKWEPTVIDTTALPYCNGGKRACIMMDPHQIGVSRGDTSILIVTQVKEVVEKRKCEETSPVCQVPGIWEQVSKKRFFTAGVEHSILQVEHSFVAPVFYEESDHHNGYSKDSKDMRGIFIGGHDKQILRRFEKGKDNRIPLENLLEALELQNLDVESPSEQNQTLRETGFYVYLDINYNNVRCDGKLECAFGTIDPVFRIRANWVPQEVQVSEIIESGDGTRVRRVSHGILVAVKQSGKIGRFSFSALLMQFLGGLGMLAIATTVVDTLGTYVLSVKSHFENMKYKMKTIVHEEDTKVEVTTTNTTKGSAKPKTE